MSDEGTPWTHWVDARRACEVLGVKRRTLYSYVSQGRVRSAAAPGTEPGSKRERRYSMEDLMHLRDRARARSGHGPVAAAALDWGDPVLESAICAIGDDGPRYRGHAALELARRDVPFEAVADLLVLGELGPRRWSSEPLPRTRWPSAGDRIQRFVARFAHWRALLPRRPSLHAAPGPSLIGPAVALLADDPSTVPEGASVASGLLAALGVAAEERRVVAVNRALVLCAEHELNASTFAARVAASAAADPFAVVLAGLATHSGARHGGLGHHVGLLVGRMQPEEADARVAGWMSRGEMASLPGFGHRLYPHGDPRGGFLLAEAEALAPRRREVRAARALAHAAARAGYEPPNLDLGLVALADALGVGATGGQAIFTVARMAGWLAHAREQADDPRLLRPRARYVGVGVAGGES